MSSLSPELLLIAARAAIISLCHLDKASDTLTIPVTSVGAVIGKGGGNLRKIEEAHGVRVEADSGSGTFTLRGEVSAIAAAKTAIRRAARDAERGETEIAFPGDKIGALIGRGGARLRRLEADTGASLDLPRDREGSGSAPLKIKVRGSPLALSKAQAVLSALATGKTVRTMPRPHALVEDLRARNAGAVERLLTSSVVHRLAISLFPGEPPLEAGSGEGEGAGLIVVSAVGADGGDAVQKAVLSLDKLLEFRAGGSFAVIFVPSVLGDVLVPEKPVAAPKAARAPRKKAAEEKKEGSGEEAADASEEAAAAAGEGEEAKEETAAAPETEAPAAASSADASVPTLASLASSTGLASAIYDREGGYVALWGAPAAVTSARGTLATLVTSFAARHAEVVLPEAWLAGALAGRKGDKSGGLNSLLQPQAGEGEGDGAEPAPSTAGVKISLEGGPNAGGPSGGASAASSKPATVVITGPNAEAVAAVKRRLGARIEQLKALRVFLVVPQVRRRLSQLCPVVLPVSPSIDSMLYYPQPVALRIRLFRRAPLGR